VVRRFIDGGALPPIGEPLLMVDVARGPRFDKEGRGFGPLSMGRDGGGRESGGRGAGSSGAAAGMPDLGGAGRAAVPLGRVTSSHHTWSTEFRSTRVGRLIRPSL
jgi:hypothetical protein